MDYKEKYEMALEGIQEILGSGEDSIKMSRLQLRLQGIFPELKESEDERIRQKLIDYCDCSHVTDTFNGIPWENVRAWLEKQGEHADFRNKIQIGDKVTRNEDGVLVNLSQLKRVAKPAEEYNITGIGSKHAQGKLGEMIKNLKPVNEVLEQKPVDKVEPKFKVKYAGSEYNVLKVKDIAGVTYYGIEDEPNHIDYIKADNCEIISGYGIKENGSPYPTKPAVFSGQKPADKVRPKFKVGDVVKHKDNPHLTYILKRFTDDGDYEFHAIGKDGNEGCTCFAVVKYQDEWELVEQNTTWNEEDEIRLKHILRLLDVKDDKKYLLMFGINSLQDLEKDIDWLKSLKDRVQPQSQWKPSDEQLKALNTMNVTGCITEVGQGKSLVELYNDLKKLREK